MRTFIPIAVVSCVFTWGTASAQWSVPGRSYRFERGYGQVEVGGRSVGVECQRGRPIPSRVSFYYPVANSIDLSTDYWRRDESLPFAIGLQINGGERRWLGRDAWSYT